MIKGLDEHLIKSYQINDQTTCIEKRIDAIDLLTHRRLDIAAKYLYIACQQGDVLSSIGEWVYRNHLDVLSNGNFREPGAEDKNSYEDYVNEFDQLISSIKEHGFQAEKSKIPVGKYGVAMNGAHRISCCIYFHHKIDVLYFPDFISVSYDYLFFRKRGLSQDVLDRMVLQYAQLKKENLYACCIWPQGTHAMPLSKIIKQFEAYGTIVYDKKIPLTYQGLVHFMIELYGKEAWTMGYEHKYKGIHHKAMACYKEKNPCYLLVFEKKSKEEIITIKAKIREIMNIKKSGMHISDNEEELMRILHLLLHPEGTFFLNHIDFLKKDLLVQMQKEEVQHALLDPYATLAFYGHGNTIRTNTDDIEQHFDMEMDTRNFIIYMGMKFMTLSFVKKQYPQLCKKLPSLEKKKENRYVIMFHRLYAKADTLAYYILKATGLHRILLYWKEHKK